MKKNFINITRNLIVLNLGNFYKLLKFYLIVLIKFLFYRNDKISKLKIIAILLFITILLIFHKIFLFFNIELIDFVQIYFNILFFYSNLVSLFIDLLIYIFHYFLKIFNEFVFFDEDGMPTYECLLGILFFKIIHIVFFEGEVPLYKMFLNEAKKIYNFIKKSNFF